MAATTTARCVVADCVRAELAPLVRQIDALDVEIDAIDAEIEAMVEADDKAGRLMTIPGVGPVTASGEHRRDLSLFDPVVGPCGRGRGAARRRSRRSAPAHGPQRPHAVSAPGHVGMGKGADRGGKLPSRTDRPALVRRADAGRAQRRHSRPCDNRHRHKPHRPK